MIEQIREQRKKFEHPKAYGVMKRSKKNIRMYQNEM